MGLALGLVSFGFIAVVVVSTVFMLRVRSRHLLRFGRIVSKSVDSFVVCRIHGKRSIPRDSLSGNRFYGKMGSGGRIKEAILTTV